MLVVVSAVLALGLLMASPAVAQNTGTGAAEGSGRETVFEEGRDFGTQERPFCQEVLNSEYKIDFVGAFSAANASTGETALYVGPAQMTITTTETYFVSPEGTYGNATSAGGCDPLTFGPAGPVNVTVQVTSPNFTSAPDGILCQNGTGEYFRVTNAFTVQWTGECEVKQGGQTVETGDMTEHLVEAQFVPCFEGSTPPGCTESTLEGAVWNYEGTD